jgi:hypothetical protein
MQEAFANLQKEAEEEYGSDPYNGEINNCFLQGDKSSQYKSKDELINYVRDKTGKRDAYGIVIEKPVGNTNKVKTQVDNTPQKGTRKWETVYQAENWLGDVILTAPSQTECIKKARAWVEKNPETQLRITIAKKLVVGNRECAVIKYKKAQGERLGTYFFAAWAPE